LEKQKSAFISPFSRLVLLKVTTATPPAVSSDDPAEAQKNMQLRYCTDSKFFINSTFFEKRIIVKQVTA
jgi:hypothetical protein